MIEHVFEILLLLSLLYLVMTCILLERLTEDEFIFYFRNAILFFIFLFYRPFQPVHHLLFDVSLELGHHPSIDICEIIVCNCWAILLFLRCPPLLAQPFLHHIYIVFILIFLFRFFYHNVNRLRRLSFILCISLPFDHLIPELPEPRVPPPGPDKALHTWDRKECRVIPGNQGQEDKDHRWRGTQRWAQIETKADQELIEEIEKRWTALDQVALRGNEDKVDEVELEARVTSEKDQD